MQIKHNHKRQSEQVLAPEQSPLAPAAAAAVLWTPLPRHLHLLLSALLLGLFPTHLLGFLKIQKLVLIIKVLGSTV